MVSKSRGRKTGTTAGTTRKSKQAKQSDDALVSSDGLIALDTERAAEGEAELSAESAKPVRRRSRKAAAASTPVADEVVPAVPPKRSRKAAPKGPLSRKKASEATPTAEPEPLAPLPAVPDESLFAPVADIEEGATFAEAFADAFLYTPDLEPSSESEPHGGAEPLAEVVSAQPDDSEPAVPFTAMPAEDALQPVTAETPADLPFIVDVPREVVAPEEVKAAAEWVDQVLEPTKVVSPPRPRERVATVRPAARAATKAVPRSAAKTAKSPAAALASALNPPVAAKPAAKPVAGAAPATRWWLVLPVFLVAAVLLFANRPGKKHAPVPDGVLGTWTTAFWLYEHQTLEIKPDTVVATLDETDEGRFPITAVETSDAGRELLVKITYRNDRGDEKVLDFLADKDPTTALRFRAHSGLVWVKAE